MPTSSASAVRSSPTAAVGGPMRATWVALALCGVALVPVSAATLRAHTVSRTVLLTCSSRFTTPLSPGVRAPIVQLNTGPTGDGAGVALTYLRPAWSVSVWTTMDTGG